MITNYSNIVQTVHKNGGISINQKNETPKTGYMVSLLGYEKKLRKKQFNEKTVKEYLNKYQRYMNSNNMYFGIWIEKKSVYMDISLNIQDQRKAILSGKANKQIAIYNIEENNTIFLNK